MTTAPLFLPLLLAVATGCALLSYTQVSATSERSEVEKRKPNFIRFGRSAGNSDALSFGKKGSDPNFLRFGRSASPLMMDEEPWLAAEKRLSAGTSANFLRFGKSSDPNFLRFGKRAPVPVMDTADPNFLRFGRKLPNNNFLRFGRSVNFDKFGRDSRQPNFLRFG